MKRHARRVAALALGSTLLVSCSALGSDSTAAGPGPGGIEKGNIKVSTVPTVDLAAFWIAGDRGYFKAEGINVQEVSVLKTEDSLTKIESGEADLGLSTYPAIFLALRKGVFDLSLIADCTWASRKSNQIVTVPNSGVSNVHDLAGKTIAVSSITQASGVLTKSVMDENGVDFSGVNWQQMPFPNMAHALEAHQVAAAYMPEPFVTQAGTSVHAAPVIDIASGSNLDFPLTGFAALRKFAQGNPNTVAAFQRAMFKATRYAIQHREAVEEAVVRHAKVTDDVAKLMTLPGMGSTLDARRIQRVPDLLKRLGVIDQTVDAASKIAPQFTG